MADVKHIEVNGTTYDIADEEARTNATEAKSTAEEAQSTATEALEKAKEAEAGEISLKMETDNNSTVLTSQKGEEDPEVVGYCGRLTGCALNFDSNTNVPYSYDNLILADGTTGVAISKPTLYNAYGMLINVEEATELTYTGATLGRSSSGSYPDDVSLKPGQYIAHLCPMADGSSEYVAQIPMQSIINDPYFQGTAYIITPYDVSEAYICGLAISAHDDVALCIPKQEINVSSSSRSFLD